LKISHKQLEEISRILYGVTGVYHITDEMIYTFFDKSVRIYKSDTEDNIYLFLSVEKGVIESSHMADKSYISYYTTKKINFDLEMDVVRTLKLRKYLESL